MIFDKNTVTLEQLAFKKLTDRDRIDILDHIISELKEIEGNDHTLDRINSILIKISIKLDAASTKNRTSPLSARIKELNAKRKAIISNIFAGITFFKEDSDREISSAALEIERIYIKHLKNLPDQKKRTLSAAIVEFLKLVESGHLGECAKRIHLNKKIEELRQTESELEQLTYKRARDKSHNTPPSVLEARSEMFTFYESLKSTLFVKTSLKEPGSEELVHKLNGRIGQIMATARRIFSLKENKDKREELIEHEAPSKAEQESFPVQKSNLLPTVQTPKEMFPAKKL